LTPWCVNVALHIIINLRFTSAAVTMNDHGLSTCMSLYVSGLV